MAKIVYNACYGGFSVSHEGMLHYAALKGITLYPEEGQFGYWTYWTTPDHPAEHTSEEWMAMSQDERIALNKFYHDNQIGTRDFDREDPFLVQTVEDLGDAASGQCAQLRIETVPDGTSYRIDEYDGNESVVTREGYNWTIAGRTK